MAFYYQNRKNGYTGVVKDQSDFNELSKKFPRVFMAISESQYNKLQPKKPKKRKPAEAVQTAAVIEKEVVPYNPEKREVQLKKLKLKDLEQIANEFDITPEGKTIDDYIVAIIAAEK